MLYYLSGMSKISGIDRTQTSAFPITLEEMIPEDHPARVIDAYIEGLDLVALGFIQKGHSIEGRPGYDTKVLLKIYLYGYLNRIRTSRLLERECKRNVELIWLIGGLRPCFRTIAGFRSDNVSALENLFRSFVQLLRAWNLFDASTVAIDGTKLRAVNSKKNNYNPNKIERQLEYIDNRITTYLTEMEKADAAEDHEAADTCNAELITQLNRKRKYHDLAEQLKQSGHTQVSTTDPDARSMIIHGQVVEVCYNIQTAVDDKHCLIAHYQVTNENDRKALVPAAVATKSILKAVAINVLADKGYDNDEQLHECAAQQIITYVAQQDIPRKNPVPTEAYYGDKFIFDPNTDTYVCPAGETLKTPGTWYEKKYKHYVTPVKHYRTGKCKTCPVREQCTTNPNGRIIERTKYTEAAQANAERIKTQKHIYQKRQQIVEHVFGTIKRQWGFDHILLKGLEKNHGELGLIYLTYNLRRVLNIIGAKELINRLKMVYSSAFTLSIPIRCNRTEKLYERLRLQLGFYNVMLVL